MYFDKQLNWHSESTFHSQQDYLPIVKLLQLSISLLALNHIFTLTFLYKILVCPPLVYPMFLLLPLGFMQHFKSPCQKQFGSLPSKDPYSIDQFLGSIFPYPPISQMQGACQSVDLILCSFYKRPASNHLNFLQELILFIFKQFTHIVFSSFSFASTSIHIVTKSIIFHYVVYSSKGYLIVGYS